MMSNDRLYCDSPQHTKRRVLASKCGAKFSLNDQTVIAHSHLCGTHATIERRHGARIVPLAECHMLAAGPKPV